MNFWWSGSTQNKIINYNATTVWHKILTVENIDKSGLGNLHVHTGIKDFLTT